MRLPSGAAIERVADEDIFRVATIERAAFAASRAVPFDDTVARIREELARPWSRIWVARTDGRVVAFVLVWRVVDEVHVLNLATEPDARRRGHAALLLRTVIADAQRDGGRLILLEVRRSNDAALALYRRHGFTESGVRRRYYDDGEDAVEMSLVLPAPASTAQPEPVDVRDD